MLYKEFTFIDFLFATIWLLMFTVLALYIRQKNVNNPLYRFFLAAYAYKIAMGFLYAVIYVYVYNGGDTLAYWKGGDVLNNLFYDSPVNYLTEIWRDTSKIKYIPSCYSLKTGYPPTWIYFEKNSWFVCKLSSFFSFFSFGSYVAINLIFSFLSFYISFKFYLFVDKITKIKSELILIAVVFVPSVSFWCGGISKDTIVFCFSLLSIMYLWKLIYEKFTFRNTLIALFSIYCLIQSRPFILIAIFLPLFVLLVFRLNRNSPFITRLITRVIGITTTVVIIAVFFRFSELLGEFSTSKLVSTAETTYNDFQVNQVYTGKRYDLGISDFSTQSLVRAGPLAILTSIYRPFIWEAESVLMLLNGLESVFLIFMTFQLLRKKKSKHMLNIEKSDTNRDFIIFCIAFVIILAFFVGLTSGLFGVLSRQKAPILPFFMLFLFNRIHKKSLTDQNTIPNSNQKLVKTS
ncbi:MAG: hypothetical protein ACK476_16020 [Fluviicola sp.]